MSPLISRNITPIALVVVAACGSTVAQRTGTFTATFTTGAGAPAQISGSAPSFSVESKGGWYTQMVTEDGESAIFLFFGGAALPPVGVHQVDNYIDNDGVPPAGRFAATGSIKVAALAIAGLNSLSGTVEITSSSPDAVSGTFTYQAQRIDGGPVVTVSGSFTTENRTE
ncbi:MAG: hypothetical protein R2882_04035 [Gemmatimonadales bacterium]